MLSHYHGGAYGLLIDNRWSCCGSGQRMSSGCVPAKGSFTQNLQYLVMECIVGTFPQPLKLVGVAILMMTSFFGLCIPDLQCHRSSSMSAVMHGGHGRKHRKLKHMNTISEGHHSLARRHHLSSPCGPSEAAVSLINSESIGDETVSESYPAAFTAGSSSPYSGRRVIPRRQVQH